MESCIIARHGVHDLVMAARPLMHTFAGQVAASKHSSLSAALLRPATGSHPVTRADVGYA